MVMIGVFVSLRRRPIRKRHAMLAGLAGAATILCSVLLYLTVEDHIVVTDPTKTYEDVYVFPLFTTGELAHHIDLAGSRDKLAMDGPDAVNPLVASSPKVLMSAGIVIAGLLYTLFFSVLTFLLVGVAWQGANASKTAGN